ncbi:MAG: hypothetical protein ORN55_00865 [Chitinophagaceae bacterium]|nr:hypothetical protein [Chitinophagaceae bacterium]
MARIKKQSRIISNAKTRLSALVSIDPNMDLGNGLTATIYEKAITLGTDLLSDYNTTLSTVDEKLNKAQAQELVISDLSERMLAGVASKYGKIAMSTKWLEALKKVSAKNQLKKVVVKQPNFFCAIWF